MTPHEFQQAARKEVEDLAHRRRQIGHGLRFSHYAVVVASILVGLLAVAAVWLSREAQNQAEKARAAGQRAEANSLETRRASDRLWQIGSEAAGLQRASRQPGQRIRTLDIIREAIGWQASRALRDEAISALLLPDAGTNIYWRGESGFEIAGAFDATLEHSIQNNDRGRAIVQRASDGAILMDEPGLGRGTPFWQFSPDSRLAAIAFFGGKIGVWDWKQTNLLANLPAINSDWGEPAFDFSPDGKSMWVLATPDSLREYHLETSDWGRSISLEGPAVNLRLSPSGELAAVAFRQGQPSRSRIEIWDLTSHTQRVALYLTNNVWQMAWQPGGERLAIGCEGGLFIWETGQTNAETIRPDGGITGLVFTRDGDLLITGGWSLPAEFWNLRTRQLVLQIPSVKIHQLSEDQTRLATEIGRVGFGTRQFLPPVGVRDWPAPASLGTACWSADVDPLERWLISAFTGGWCLRDAASGRELSRREQPGTLAASFSADGSNILAWTRAGLKRWPVVMNDAGNHLAIGESQTLWQPGRGLLDLGLFAAGRRRALCAQDGMITVVSVDSGESLVSFPLQHRGDNSFYLSPDGRQLVTGHHNQQGADWYDAHSGKWLRHFADEGLSGPVFDPYSGRLFTCNADGFTLWDQASGQSERTASWSRPGAYQAFLAFAPDQRLALVNFQPARLNLLDLRTGRDFATLDFRDHMKLFSAHWSAEGRFIFLFGEDGGVTRLDLPTLRSELEALGLDWPDDEPTRGFLVRPEALSGSDSVPAPLSRARIWRPANLLWLVGAGMLITIGIGFSILRHQHRLFASYLETETLARLHAEKLRTAQAALLHHEKMQALGTMAAGVAHDFNNLLSVIRLSSELIEEKAAGDPVTQENFHAIQQAVLRGRGIVNSMLGYARDDGKPQHFAPSELISDAVAMLSKPFLSGLVLEIETGTTIPSVLGRKGRIAQMLLNLIINASEAMGGRGKLKLQARETRDARGCVLPPRKVERWVELEVADSGPGIPPETLQRIFEPFFTTKTKGGQRGTGLGLSMLYAMAREDGVGVWVTSEPGRGTTFRLLLPVDAPTEPGTTRPLAGDRDPEKTGGEHD